ncbi:MAG: SpoIIE family protein phosphatase [Prevotella sp.]|nr:SpoIIE family protein phosphatase [Prevotella sp.]
MMKHFVILICLFLSTIGASANRQDKEKGDSIYNRLVELSLRDSINQLQMEKDAALAFFSEHEQWDHYYYIATLCTTSKVMYQGQMMTGLRECRKLYEFARDQKHNYGRGIVMAQIAWLYGFIGDHEAALRQMREAFSILRRYPMTRESIALLYHYAYTLELTGNYEEEAAMIKVAKPLIRSFEWGDTATLIYRTYHDNLLNAETLMEVRRGQLTKAGKMVDRLIAKMANNDEQNEYEALRAIAEYYKAKGDYALALATTDRMKPLANNSGLQWGWGLLRTEILHKLGRSEEAYNLLRPMIDMRSNDRMGQLRQQLNEMDTMTELDELRFHRHQMQFWYAVGIAFVIIVALGVFLVLRHRAAKKLKKANTQLQEAYDQLEETTTAKERIESELRIARDIQMSMVPRVFPTCDHLDLFATMTPAREVGGDLYDVQHIDQHLYFCVGDVSGKGVPASLFMAQVIRLFRTMAKFRTEPSEIATFMNNELTSDNESGMFVTMFIGKLDMNTGRLEFCNCGHNAPIVGCGSQKAHFLEMENNAVIGLFPDIKFVGEVMEDIRNTMLFVYTDGLNEAENPQQEQFGDDRLLEVMQQHPYTSAHELIDTMTELVEQHRQGADPNDDLTMLCLRYN